MAVTVDLSEPADGRARLSVRGRARWIGVGDPVPLGRVRGPWYAVWDVFPLRGLGRVADVEL